MIKLKKAHVTKYKSIEDSNEVLIADKVTTLVGQNESGKTGFLEALDKTLSAENNKFDVVSDYPRKDVSNYKRQHDTDPDKVVELEFELDNPTLKKINSLVFEGAEVVKTPFKFTYAKKYDNSATINLMNFDKPFINHYKNNFKDIEKGNEAFTQSTVKGLIANLDTQEIDPESKLGIFLENWKSLLKDSAWEDAVGWYVWTKIISPALPRFAYFDDYKLLEAKVNLPALKSRVGSNTTTQQDEGVLGLLQLAGIDLEDLLKNEGYESGRANLEAISIQITDQIFQYWTQNKQLEVLFDIADDPKELPPFNTGKNLYIRIKNNKHRVTLPFDQRSKGFIWFFSFMVWFQSIQERIGTDRDLILLLDEPGLNLHALAQKDLLRYIDNLATSHQIIFSTHSPFMVESANLDAVRVVEDKDIVGTKISGELQDSDQKSLFPLQAALGYTIAQNLFIGSKNLLIEGPADLLYLQFISRILEESQKQGFSEDIVLVPTGGVDKIATFVALLGANDLKIAVLHDFKGSPEQRLEDLIRQKLIDTKKVLHYAEFRSTPKSSKGDSIKLKATDIEDLLPINLYLDAFNKTYSKELAGLTIKEGDLPQGERIIQRIKEWLNLKNINLRKDGDFNHYRVANTFLSLGLDSKKFESEELKIFEALILKVNSLF